VQKGGLVDTLGGFNLDFCKSPEFSGALSPSFPRAPSPETRILLPHGRSSKEKVSLSRHENADLFCGMMKLQPGDISNALRHVANERA